MRHRSEMRRNSKYQYFVQQCSLDPRVRKRDIITFISRPVTRLPRLQLLLENAKKYTEPDHPDSEAIPLILGILNEFIRGTQPGIEAAEEKVKYWSLCESLVYQKGEIIVCTASSIILPSLTGRQDLDLYDDTRSLQYQGRLSRKYRSEMNYHWADLHVALLDNYRAYPVLSPLLGLCLTGSEVLLLKPDVRPNDGRSNPPIRHHVVSRVSAVVYSCPHKLNFPHSQYPSTISVWVCSTAPRRTGKRRRKMAASGSWTVCAPNTAKCFPSPYTMPRQR